MELVFTKQLTGTGVAGTKTKLNAAALVAGLVTVTCPKTNTDDVFIGPDADADFYAISPGQSYGLPGTSLPQHGVDLAKWYKTSATNNQQLCLAYVPIL